MDGYMVVRISKCTKGLQTLWVHYDTPAAEWCLIDDEEQGWVFESHHEALEVLGTLADPYLVIVPIAPAQLTEELYEDA